MKNIKKIITSVLMLTIFVISTTTVNATAANNIETGALGGWDEETGYFKNVSDYNKMLLYTSSSESTPKHTGKRERNDDLSTTRFRAHGWTTWVGVYHYTRARMEEGKTILTDSNRVWGNDGTEAKSPWWSFDPNIYDKARTYYGR